MAVNGMVQTWDFTDKHLDPNIISGDGNVFFNASRCIVYGALSNLKNETSNANFFRIGVIQSYQFSENKTIDPVFELGSDIPYYVPGRTLGQLSVQRILLAGEDMVNLVYQADGTKSVAGRNKFITSLKDPRLNKAMDLLFAYYGKSNSTNSSAAFSPSYSRLFKNCYIQGRSESIMAGQVLVAEGVNIVYEYISNVNFLTENLLNRQA